MSKLHREHVDVLIVGGGMIGLSLSILLAQQDRKVMVLEQHVQPQLTDELALRVSALNDRSRQVLKQCGVWQRIKNHRSGPYNSMQVWDKDSSAHIEFSAAEVDAEDLGAIVENNVVEHFLWQRAEQLGVKIQQAPQWQLLTAGNESHSAEVQLEQQLVTADVLVGADGGRSKVRHWAELPLTFWDYQQQGIVANIRTEKPHQGIARQVFLPTGPLALLPTPEANTVSIVWSADQAFAEQLLAESPARLAKWVESESGRVLGECRCESAVKAFPLRMQYARQWQQQRLVLVGDAAHTIHPLAGQGANLGFGDVKTLAEALGSGHLKALDELQRKLSAYQRSRKAETQVMIAAMELFKRGFGTANPLLKGLRAVAFAIPNRFTPLKRKLAEIALG
ncbi:FAD-dependent monooxygenase [Idiomarina seosinensis]|uniref:Ubiquinone biosynthesis protein UbiH n=1 Tax=Idiomarina seosinensis TaxID=281739 RepID=A0A432ZBI8_9GAMM|nr:FAD-dependent monooxygenase [Idiomarina seosinensis]RUO75316.1 ubiquinone biosynthesis protein UbiH [Idiomarina seosinensis]